MTITYRTTDGTKWGAGKGSDLTASEVDLNFWDHEQRIQTIETNPVLPVEIADITLVGDQLTITMSDASTFGPFTVPAAPFAFTGPFQGTHAYLKNDFFTFNNGLYIVNNAHTSPSTFVMGPNYSLVMQFRSPGGWRDEWETATAYITDDVVKVSGVGVFLVLTDHTSTGTTFDPSNTTDYAQIGWEPNLSTDPSLLYDIALFHVGTLVANGEAYFVAPRNLKLPTTGHYAHLRTAVTATVVLKIQKNDTDIGTITFTSGANILTQGGQGGVVAITAETTFIPGDHLSVQQPASPDATAADLMVSLAALRVV